LSYQALEVSASELPEFVRALRDQEQWVGLNVTLPHKEAIIEQIDELSEEARAVGAVNVVHKKLKTLYGFNTDVLGILKTLENIALEKTQVLIFGAGGAARAAAFAMGKRKVSSVYVFNRTPEKASRLCTELNQVFPETNYLPVRNLDEIRSELSLVINSTSLGMKGAKLTSEQPLDFSEALKSLRLSRKSCAFDLVYTPENTPFLKASRTQGMKSFGGLDMLAYQALATWQIWFGSDLFHVYDELLQKLRDSARDVRPIFLTGFMGVGKSRVAAEIARKIGWRVFDTDQMIVKDVGMSVAEIFSQKGEAFFRQSEKEVIARVAQSTRAVVALGGGALMNPESLNSVKKWGRLVYLHADPETLHARVNLSQNKRPLLAGLSEEEKIEKIKTLYAQRQPIYLKAEFKIETGGQTPAQIAEQVIADVFEENPSEEMS
jgi:shikimate dehydrogenase